MIEIAIDQNTVEAGDFLIARIHWAGDRRVNRIIAAAQWETAGKGNRVWGVGRSRVFVPNRGAHEATFPVRLMIPHEGPVSFEGTLIAIAWTLKVRVDQSGIDEYEEAPFRVEPRVVRRDAERTLAMQPG
ncbi:MAG: hypothetical protein ACXVJT_11810 [Thermoanaerobaculia bacterium]